VRLGERGRRARFGARRGESLFCQEEATGTEKVRNVMVYDLSPRGAHSGEGNDRGPSEKRESPKQMLHFKASAIISRDD
jgi:hypothetical protein